MKKDEIFITILAALCLIGGGGLYKSMVELSDAYKKDVAALQLMVEKRDKEINELTYQRNVYEAKVHELEELLINPEPVPEIHSVATYKITHYSSDETGSILTASGEIAQAGYTIACNSLPFGTKVRIGDNIYCVQDRGAISDNVIDIYVNNYKEAMEHGTYYAEVEILK